MISFPEAIRLIESSAAESEIVSVPLEHSSGKILREKILADRDYPPFNRATMDGFALRSQGFSKDRIYSYKRELHAGESFSLEEGEETIRIMTGAPVPEGFDLVIKVEDSTDLGNSDGKRQVRFDTDKTSSFSNIAIRGEDLKNGEEILSEGTRISSSIFSLLASLGRSRIQISKLPKVRIISTGNEIVGLEETPKPWQIRDSNSYSIRSLLQKYDISPISIVRVGDDLSQLEKAVLEGLDSDILILSGGVSMGNLDLVPKVLEGNGVREIFHKVRIKPGKPIWFGMKGRQAVFGLPGNPFSVQVCFRIFVESYIRKFLCLPTESSLLLPFSGERKKKNQLTEFFPVRLEKKQTTVLTENKNNGSGDIRAGIFSDGLAVQFSEKEKVQEGELLEFYPWN
ncbi:molybdopterin molybdenumtransferase MoeA [Leptospira langatensis]|uniref:Molybdopterin molybdenumtransferase n=1 Tax=Leptospira langatensis TaxID=2484983 RepID=A0A5F1ZUA8_9LEPT|nr:molybdopterin molybdotransferase MoeA [Leptospira langatensis]TGK01507.1 molybdopterin molybdenumtransferase MoeA [Leptospira langatensis]TGL42043.1 molybdopterin molybdenumtransferase MoeA [Leptospira langatensis]